MQTRLFIDSSHCEPGSINGIYKFKLSTVVTAREIQIVRVQLANTIHNVFEQNSIRFFGPGSGFKDVKIPAGFYTPQDLADTVNKDAGTTPYVTFSDKQRLQWDLTASGARIDVLSSFAPCCGFPAVAILDGKFETTPALGLPCNVAFCIPQIDYVNSVSSGPSTCRPTVIVPLVNGYGLYETYEPSNPYRIKCSANSLSHLVIEIRDPTSGLIINSASHWSMEIILY